MVTANNKKVEGTLDEIPEVTTPAESVQASAHKGGKKKSSKRSKAPKSGESTNMSGSSKGDGKGVYSTLISIHGTPYLRRGEGDTITVGGRVYRGAPTSPRRQSRLQAIAEPKLFDISGRHPMGAVSATTTALEYTFVPSLRFVDWILDEGFSLLRQQVQKEQGILPLPEELNTKTRFKNYIETYMAIRLMVGELSTWQHLGQYDMVHSTVLTEGARAENVSRINQIWMALSQFRMWKPFVDLCDKWNRAVASSSEGIVYHNMWPWDSDRYAWGLTAAANDDIEYFSGISAFGLRTTAHFRNIEDTCYALLSVLNRSHADLSDDDKEDITHIQDLLYILEMPGHPMVYNDWSSMIASEFLLDQYMYRGMYLGVDTTADTVGPPAVVSSGYQVYPRPDSMNENIEFRWMGEWDDDLAKGMIVPLCALNNDTLGLLGKFSNLGVIHPGGRVTALYGGGVRYMQTASQNSIFPAATTVSTRKARTVEVPAPFLRHQYAVTGTVAPSQHAVGQEPVVNDPVDHSVYLPIADVGEHYLGWLSQALGLPIA